MKSRGLTIWSPGKAIGRQPKAPAAVSAKSGSVRSTWGLPVNLVYRESISS
nr:hypothetical protein [Sphingobacterium sp. UDSM-2020]